MSVCPMEWKRAYTDDSRITLEFSDAKEEFSDAREAKATMATMISTGSGRASTVDSCLALVSFEAAGATKAEIAPPSPRKSIHVPRRRAYLRILECNKRSTKTSIHCNQELHQLSIHHQRQQQHSNSDRAQQQAINPSPNDNLQEIVSTTPTQMRLTAHQPSIYQCQLQPAVNNKRSLGAS